MTIKKLFSLLVIFSMLTASPLLPAREFSNPSSAGAVGATGPTGANGSSGALLQITKTLTKSETRTMATSPVTVVADPGAGFVNILKDSYIEFIPGTTPPDFYWDNNGLGTYQIYSITVTALIGTFQIGEDFTAVPSGNTATIRKLNGSNLPTRVTADPDNLPQNGDVITGSTSGATGTITVAPLSVSGAFTIGETLTDASTSTTAKVATVDGSGFPLDVYNRSAGTFGGNANSILVGGTSGKEVFSGGLFNNKVATSPQLYYSDDTATQICSIQSFSVDSVASLTDHIAISEQPCSSTSIHRNKAIVLSTGTGSLNWSTVNDDSHGDSTIRVVVTYITVPTNANFLD